MKTLTHFLFWELGLASAETQTTEQERATLAQHAAGSRRVVEIGSWHGVTTKRLRQIMSTDGILYAIDPFPTGRLGISFQKRIAHAEVSRVQNGTVRWVRETSRQAAQTLHVELNGKVDFLFIDGDHSFDGLRTDWEDWSPLVVPGGLIALHDSRSTAARPIPDAGSVRYTAEVIRHDPRFNVIDEIDSLTILRRGDQ